MFRPDGWENPYEEDRFVFDREWSDFEAGADAMLEGLKANGGVYINEEDVATISVPLVGKTKGWLVFIPEEE